MEKIFLRKLMPKDAPRMLEWQHDAEVMQYLQFNGLEMTLDDTQQFINEAQDTSHNMHLAIVDAGDIYYGTISLKNIDKTKAEAEYAIALHSQAQGRGIALSASREILRLASTELGLKRVYLNVIQDNYRAVCLYKKLGFQYMYQEKNAFKGQTDVVLCWYEIML